MRVLIILEIFNQADRSKFLDEINVALLGICMRPCNKADIICTNERECLILLVRRKRFIVLKNSFNLLDLNSSGWSDAETGRVTCKVNNLRLHH
jgi:hypothetical protein